MATRGVTSAEDAADEVTPYYEQQPFMGRSKRFYGFISGTGAGKTFAGVYRLWLNATAWNPNSMGAIIVPDKSQFIDNVKPIMEDFNLLETWEYKSVYTDEPGLVTETGERILILSADNQRQIGRIKGKNLAYFWMDEEAEIPPRARQIAEQRLRVGRYPNGFITTTPDGKNHTWEFFDGDVTANKYTHGEGTIYDADDRLAIVGVPPEANPIIRDEDIASMRRSLPDQIVAQEIEGEFVEIGSGVFTRDMVQFSHVSDLADHELRYLVGVDVGVEADSTRASEQDTDYWAAALVGYDPMNKEAFLIDVKRDRGMSLNQGVAWLQQVVAPLGDNHVELHIESNQAQRWLQQALSDAGLNARAVMNTSGKEDRLVQLSLPIERGDIQFLNQHVDDQLGYDPRFQDLISEMLAFPEGQHDDQLDALQIAVDQLDFGGYDIMGADPYGRRDE